MGRGAAERAGGADRRRRRRGGRRAASREALEVRPASTASVHAAAVVAYGRIEDVPAEVFDRVRTNLLGAVQRRAARALRFFARQGDGTLVVVGSVLGKIATPYIGSVQFAGKWGVHGPGAHPADRGPGHARVRISLVSPGGVDTPICALAGSCTGRVGRPPPPVDPPEKVARAVVRAIGRPRREVSVGLANGLTVTGFRLLPGVFDLLVTPLMRWGGRSPGGSGRTPATCSSRSRPVRPSRAVGPALAARRRGRCPDCRRLWGGGRDRTAARDQAREGRRSLSTQLVFTPAEMSRSQRHHEAPRS